MFFCNIRSIKREGFLDPQALHGLHTVRFQSEFLPGLQNVVPQGGGFLGGNVKFIAQLAGISGAGDQHFRLVDAGLGKAEKRETFQVGFL